MIEYLCESDNCYHISEFYSISAQTVGRHGQTYKRFETIEIYQFY